MSGRAATSVTDGSRTRFTTPWPIDDRTWRASLVEVDGDEIDIGGR